MEKEAAPPPCPECSGHGGDWPDNPSICGGVPCPVCNGVCEACLGHWLTKAEGVISCECGFWIKDTDRPIRDDKHYFQWARRWAVAG